VTLKFDVLTPEVKMPTGGHSYLNVALGIVLRLFLYYDQISKLETFWIFQNRDVKALRSDWPGSQTFDLGLVIVARPSGFGRRDVEEWSLSCSRWLDKRRRIWLATFILLSTMVTVSFSLPLSEDMRRSAHT